MKKKSLKLLGIFVFILIILNSKAETDKYRLIYNNDPSTSITIAWCQKSGNKAIVYFGEKDLSQRFNIYPFSQKTIKTVEYKKLKHCFATLKNLKPDTKYYFVIRDTNSVSRRFCFKTIPKKSSARLSIIAGGDSRTYREPSQKANLMVSKLQPHFVMFNGDFTVHGNSQEWVDWLDDWQLTINKDGRIIPLVIIQGNHESSEDVYKIFCIPNKGIYYSLNFGGNLLHAIVLNTEIKIKGKQTKWLKQDLTSDDCKNSIWKIVSFHKPIRPHYSKKKEGKEQYKYWANLFYIFGVNLVIEGDTHICSRTWPIIPDKNGDEGFVRNDASGTIYIGEGTWGAPVRAADDTKAWTRDCAGIHQFKWIFVSHEKIEIRAVKYLNVDEVSSLTIDNQFQMPENIDIWTPENGAVIEINNNEK